MAGLYFVVIILVFYGLIINFRTIYTDSILQTMKFAQKLEMGYRLNAKQKKNTGIPPLPLPQGNQPPVTLGNPLVDGLEKNPFLSDYMSKFVDEIKFKSKSPSKSPPRLSTKHERSGSQSKSSSRSSSKSKSSLSTSVSKSSHSLSKSRKRSRSGSRSSRRSTSKGRFSKNRRSRSPSPRNHRSRSPSSKKHRSRSRSRSKRNSRSKSKSELSLRYHRLTHSRSKSPKDSSGRRGFREHGPESDRGAFGSSYGSHHDRRSPVSKRVSPLKSRWDNSPPIPGRKSRWDQSSSDAKLHDSFSKEKFLLGMAAMAKGKSDYHSRQTKEMIGKTLNEMEAYVELAKQKKLEEMKKRNKDFLKQSYDW